MIPVNEAHIVAKMPIKTKSKGCSLPNACLMLMTVVGSNVTPAVFKTRKVTISSLAVCSSKVDNSFNLFIPFKPLGGGATFR